MSDTPSVNPSVPVVTLTASDRLRLAMRAPRAAWRSAPRPAAVAVMPTGALVRSSNPFVVLASSLVLVNGRPQLPGPRALSSPAGGQVRLGLAQSGLRLAPSMGSRQLPMDLFKPSAVHKLKPNTKPKPIKVSRTPEEARSRLFKQLDITALGQALLCVPTSYVDCVNTKEILTGLYDGYKGLFYLRRTGKIEALDAKKRVVSAAPHTSFFEAPWQTHWRQVRTLKVELEDLFGNSIWVASFNPWRWKNSDPQGAILIDGTVQTFGTRRMLINTSEPPADVAGKVWARYVSPGTAKEEDIRSVVAEALNDPESFQQAIHSLVTSTLLSEKQLLTLASTVTNPFRDLREFFSALHCPSDTLEGDFAVEVARLMAVTGVCNAARASSMRYPHPKAAINFTDLQVRVAVQSQPETLTVDQAAVVAQLVACLRSPQPLNGLLSGDVGTGKTLAYLIPAVVVARAGGRVALVSPTEILANQLATNLQRRFPDVAVERVRAGGRISNPQAILVDTSGLASVAKKSGYCPDFLVVDEQHKLATKDRNSMVGPWTHHLEASATPIPRSLAATLFNGTQVFSLNEAPVVRQIESFVFDETDRRQVSGWMREALDDRQRVAIIYPRVEKSAVRATEEDETPGAVHDSYGNTTSQGDFALPTSRTRALPVASVTEAAQGLEQRFPGKVGMLHGKLAAAEIAGTLDDFRSGVRPIVVASTIMETGIDIPDIRLLVVKDAENFGAAQLHQLRGRLARNGGAARFVMMVKDCAGLVPETLDRLLMVSRTTDGYALAEADMKNRGFGDLAGLAQSGRASSAFRLLKLELSDFVLRFGEQESGSANIAGDLPRGDCDG